MLRIFRSEALTRTIALLALNEDGELGLKEIAARVGVTRTNVSYLMRFLEEDGLVARRSVGKKNLYRILTDHPLYPELYGIAIKTFGGQDAVLGALRDDEKIVFASIFGSYAKGSTRPGSDVDVLVVIDDDDADETDYRVATSLALAGDRIGRPVHANIVRRSELSTNPVVESILNGPMIRLKGSIADV